METRHWLIGGGIVVAIGAVIVAMTALNVSDAIAKCEQSGYEKPEWSLSVTSCPADLDYAYDSVALVVGNTANTPKPKLTENINTYLLNSLAHTKGDLKPVIYSATPSGYQIKRDEPKVRSSSNVGSFIRNSKKQLEFIEDSIAQPPTENNADYFNNIVTAARAVKSSPKSESSLVIVIGSGLSDSQPLNFTQSDILHADPSSVIDSLKQSSSLIPGELSGVSVVWSGLGVVSAPQPALDAKEKASLENLYRMILQQMGATVVFDNSLTASDSGSVETDYTVGQVDVTGTAGGVVVFKLGEDSIGFRRYTSQIIDESVANKALEGVVESFQACPAAKVSVEGYQALAEGEGVQQHTDLSQQRADEVKRLLISQGVAPEQVEAHGKGSSDFEGRVDEMGQDGVWSEELAQQNRVVLIKMEGGSACN